MKSISKNYLYNLSYQILTLLTPLITTPYISRVLGADGIGIYSYTTSIVTYFILLGTLGLSDYGQREIAYNQNNQREQTRILYEVCILRIGAVICSLVLYYMIVLKNIETNYYIFVIQMLNIVALLFDTSWFFQGLEEFGKIIIRNLIIRILSIVMLFVFINESSDLWLYVLLNGMMTLIGGIWVSCYLPKYVVKIEWKLINPCRNFKIIIQLFLPQIAIQIYTVMDKTMIGLFTNLPSENGYYEQAEKCIKLVLTIVTSFGAVMLPRVAAAYANNKLELIYEYIMKSFRFVCFLSLPMIAMIISVSPNFVPWFFGDGYDKVIILLQMFSFLLLAIGLSQVIGVQYLVATNRQNLMSFSVFCGAFVNFLSNLVLIPKFMSVGATISSIIAEFIVTLVQFYIVKDKFCFSTVILLSKKYFYISVCVFFIIYEINKILLPSICNTLLLIMMGTVIYVLGLWICKDEMLFFLQNKISRYVKNNLY